MNDDVIDAAARPLAVVEQAPKPIAGILDAETPEEFMERAARICTLTVNFITERGLVKNVGGGKKHVELEGWLFLGAMPWIRITPVIEWTREVVRDGKVAGYEARAVAYRDGAIVGSGEGLCMFKESNWSGKDEFTVKSMAQTRASSRAMQGPLRWIMVMAGYQGAGAEEMSRQRQRQQTQPRRTRGNTEDDRKRGLAAVHALQSELGWSDKTYRSFMARVFPDKWDDAMKATSAELDAKELRILYKEMKAAGSG